MARLTISILEIGELKWMGRNEFNSDDHYIYYRGKESIRRNGLALIINKRVQNRVFGSNLKNDRMICSFIRQTIQYHSNPSLCPNTNAEEVEVEWFYDDLQDLLELTPKKDVLFITGTGMPK